MNSFLLRAKTGIFIIALFVLCIFLPVLFLKIIFYSCFSLILLCEWPELCRKNSILWFLTPFYPGLPFFLTFSLLQESYGKMLVLLLLFLVIVFDSGSYVAGFFFGKIPLCPKISPGKTIEGLIGGFCMLLLVATCYLYGFAVKNKMLFLFHTILIGFSALFGDLFESLLKRMAAKKDSGSILPGHGGLLDRFDAFLGAVVYLYLVKSSLLTLFI